MDDVFDGVDPERAWAAVVAALLAVFGIGSVVFPRTVYAEFVWHYFWGPVYADANGASCVAWANGDRRLLGSEECAALQTDPERLAELGPVAEPGYTLVSEVGYVVILLVALVGVIFLLKRIDIQRYRTVFYALFPFMLFGGALRVVEDANDALPAAETPISYPLNTLIISPVIYFTVFAVAVGALLLSVALARGGAIDRYDTALFGLGTAAFVGTLGYLSYLAAVPANAVQFHPQVLLVVLGLASASAGATWALVGRYAPGINRGTGTVGLVVLWGHAVDGAANVVGLDWMPALGAGPNLVPKHPANRLVVEATNAILPGSVLAVTGDAWPFLLVKLAAATVVVWIFDEEIFEESPRYAVLMLVAVLAVGLGPGTRDMLRATFGV
jgi:uncharacterized membrane protein